MNLQVPYANALIYYLFLFLVTATDQKNPSQYNRFKQLEAINLNCPEIVLAMCPEDEPLPYSSLSAFLAAGGSINSNCGIDSASFTLDHQTLINLFCPRTIQRTYSIKDSCGGMASCIQDILIDDHTTPSIVCPSKIIHCGETLPSRYFSWKEFYQALLFDGGLITDNCSIDTSTWQYTGEDTVLNQNCLFTVERSYSIRDSCRNLALCIHSFVFVDNAAPTFTPARDTQLYAGVGCMADTSVTNLGTIKNLKDNCNMATYSNRDVVKTVCTAFDTILRIWTVKDQCNNAAIDTQFIYVLDTSKPLITGPPGQNYVCISHVPPPDIAAIMAKDNCSPMPLKKFVRDSVSDSICLNNKTLHRIYTATDLCGNTTRFIQTFRIKDSISPILTCPAAIIVECDSDVPDPDVSSVMATDICDGTLNVIFVKDSIPQQLCVNQKIIFRIYAALDGCQNFSRCIQIITVNDQTPPSLICPPDTIVSCLTSLPPVDTDRLVVSDKCSGTVSVSFVKDSIITDVCLNQKTILRIYQAVDSCQNSIRCVQTIIVNDNDPPMLSSPGDTTVQCMSEVPDPTPASVTATDNCGETLVVEHLKDSVSPEQCINKKLIYRVYVATDECFNVGRCIQLIIVSDDEAPILTGPGNTGTLTCGDDFMVNIPSAFDHCDGEVNVDISRVTLDSVCPGTYKIIYTFEARDSCNNTVIRSDTISFIDLDPPTITCPPDLEDCYFPPFNNLDSFLVHGGTISDLCGIDSSSFKLAKETFEQVLDQIIISRKYTISDSCGNSDTCQQFLLIDPTCQGLPAPGDLALIKTINSITEPYLAKPGGLVPMCITVYNQGVVNLDSITVIDYFPAPGSKIMTPGWINHGDGTASILLCRANGGLPPVGLAFEDSIRICFDLKLNDQINISVAVNKAEVSSASDTFGNKIIDIDSNLDSDPNNDIGGQPNTPDDNNVTGDSRLLEDEDDSDPALFLICQPLTCVNHTNASVEAGPGCTHCFKASELLTGNLLPDAYYTVTLYDSYGKKLPSNCAGREFLGQKLIYTVSISSCSSNTCWGTVTLEDKSPPPLDCSRDTIYCFQLNSLPAMPTVQDNCSGPAIVSTVKEVWQDLGCQEGEIQGIFTRTLRVKDVWNNTKTCDKIYYIQRIDLARVICPSAITFECTASPAALDPSESGAPTIDGYPLWPANVACKIFVLYKDHRTELCGPGYKIVRTWIIGDHCTGEEITCTQLIKVEDRLAPVIKNLDRNISLIADPHDCFGFLDLEPAEVTDCSEVSQSYLFIYNDPNESVHSIPLSGKLPARIKVPVGINFKIYLQLSDECNHYTKDSIYVTVSDLTPPNPVCHETTQLTLDPDSCWSRIVAKDLDNGSYDNCCSHLHFAIATSDAIEEARNNFLKALQDECGTKEYWNHKSWYDEYIEDWISCYVFKDTLDINQCGSQQVVLRVYEACGMPVYDPHEFPCSPHAWYCYNTSWRFRVGFNKTFFKTGGSKDCNYRGPWACKSTLINTFNEAGHYNIAYYQTQDLPQSCDRLFGNMIPPDDCPKNRYNDCMIEILADDKQKPFCDSLEDLVIYCDGAPGMGIEHSWDLCGIQGDEYVIWPLEIRIPEDTTVYGYYGGSVKQSHDEHPVQVGACGYDEINNWQPVYCRAWLELDRFDNIQKTNPEELFYRPVIVDKKHSRRTLQPGEFLILDNCLIDSVTHKDQKFIDQCGTGWLERTWTIKDKCGNQSTCSQKIIIKPRSDFEVLFPEDKEVVCTNIAALHPDQTGRPTLADDDCEIIGIHYQDDTFNFVENACFKILRTWTLVNTCSYDDFTPDHRFKYPEIIVDDRQRANQTDRYCMFRHLKDNGDGILKYTQIIKVFDDIAPSIRCIDTMICHTGEGCEIQINLPIAGSDNCVPDLRYDLAIDADQDGQFDDGLRQHVTAIAGPFKPGIYQFRITSADQCGNINMCFSKIHIRDCKAPTPYCLNGVATVIMPTSGNLELWASDFNRGSTDNCSTPDHLSYSFDEAGNLKSKTFTCHDIPNGQFTTIPMDIWVSDEAGNRDLCKTYVLLQDNSGTPDQPDGICTDTTVFLNAVQLNGNISTEEKESVELVQVELKSDGKAYPMQVTGIDGSYLYPGIPRNGNVQVIPRRIDLPMNGVSTLDLLLIEKHIKGEYVLNSPFKMIAADADRSGDINVIDLIELRKLILGIYDVLPRSESWRFIPKTHQFKDPVHPFEYPIQLEIPAINNDTKLDFTGVKVGDVNASALPHSMLGPEIRGSNSGLVFTIADRFVKKNEWVKIGFTSPNFRGIAGFQGTLHFEGLSNLELETQQLPFTPENIGLRWANEAEITFSWQQSRSMDFKEHEVLFSLRFKALKDLRLSDHLRISSKRTRAESYEGKGELKDLGLQFIDTHGHSVSPEDKLIQNYPNPFNRSTTIGIQLHHGGKGYLRFYDLTGKQIKSIEKIWNAGYQEVVVDNLDLPAAGIYFYKFESAFFNASRKMILKL